MRCLWIMFVTAVCFLFLLKLKWPKNKNIYDDLTHNMMPFIKKVNGKPSCISLSKWPPSCATPPSSPSSSYAPASNTATHDNHEKINSCVSFTFQYGYGAPLGGLRPRSSAMKRPLRTFALIVSAHPYCARKSTCHAMSRHDRARAKC